MLRLPVWMCVPASKSAKSTAAGSLRQNRLGEVGVDVFGLAAQGDCHVFDHDCVHKVREFGLVMGTRFYRAAIQHNARGSVTVWREVAPQYDRAPPRIDGGRVRNVFYEHFHVLKPGSKARVERADGIEDTGVKYVAAGAVAGQVRGDEIASDSAATAVASRMRAPSERGSHGSQATLLATPGT